MKSSQRNALVGLILALGTSTTVFGQDMSASDSSSSFWNQPGLYHAEEFSLGMYGLGATGQDTFEPFHSARMPHDLRLGAGADGEFFITRYFGVGVEGYSETTHHSFVNDVLGDLIGRFPIGDTGWAPYGFLGGGREFEPFIQWEGHLGAGLEFRFCKHFGIFADGRYVFAQTSQNYGLARAGIRLSF
jgi:hypothetical protein